MHQNEVPSIFTFFFFFHFEDVEYYEKTYDNDDHRFLKNLFDGMSDLQKKPNMHLLWQLNDHTLLTFFIMGSSDYHINSI